MTVYPYKIDTIASNYHLPGAQFNSKKIAPKITPKMAPKMAPKIASIYTIKKVSKMAVHTGVLFKKAFRCHFRRNFFAIASFFLLFPFILAH